MDTVVAVTERATGDVVFEATATFLVFTRRRRRTDEGAAPKPADNFGSSTFDRGATIGDDKALALPRGLGRAFAAVCGDHNPIHTSPWGARLFGQRGMIAHGMCVAASACELAQRRAGPATGDCRICVDIVFKKPVTLPCRVELCVRRRLHGGREEAPPGEGDEAENEVFAEVWTKRGPMLHTVARLVFKKSC